MATTGIKFDDGSGGFASNCFPVRGLVKFGEDDSGAWIVAQKAEQRRRFKAVICTKPRDFNAIREERKRSEREGTAIVPPKDYEDDEEELKLLDGFFLMKHCCVDDPADLCSVNISGQGFSEVKEEDFQLFDNVAYVNAAENLLPLDCFKSFPILRELEMPLNGLRGISMKLGELINLELLDLSYNNLAAEDVLPLGLLPNLRVLHLTGNGLTTLLPDMAHPHVEQLKNGNRKIQRFANLEILLLDDNRLADLAAFAALAGLRKLKHLNLSKNEIYSVPQLMLVEGRHVTQEFDDGIRSHGKTPKSGRKSSKSRRSSRKSGRKSEQSMRSRGDNRAGSISSISKLQQPVQRTETIDPPQSEISTGEFLKEVQHLVRADGESRKTDPSLLLGTQNNTQLTDRDVSNLTTARDTTGELKQTSDISDSVTASNKNNSQDVKPQIVETNNSQETNTISGAEQNGADPRTDSIGEKDTANEGTLHRDNEIHKSMDSLLDLDDMLEELNLDKIDEKVVQDIEVEKQQIEEEKQKEAMLEGVESTYQEYTDDPDLPLPPPFPELRYLNLAHNSIEEEEGLLAVAAWPMLTEMVIYDNPLTTEHRGDPPLLKRFLHDRLGIHIERLKPSPITKPHIEVRPDPTRTVKTLIPPVPRCDVDALLALEYHSSTKDYSPTPKSGRSSASPTQGGFDGSQPLPPIQQTTLDGGMIIEEEDEDEFEDYEDQPYSSSPKEVTPQDQAFFMTAVNDQMEEPAAASSEKEGKKNKKKKEVKKPVSGRYKGYEELLDIDETKVKDDIPTPKDISGNIRALQYTLNHPLVFRENRVYLDRPQKPYEPFVKGMPRASKPRKPRTYVVEEAISFLKERRTTEEEALHSVLKNPKQYKKHFSDAPDLLAQVQHKYNRVRVKSVREARDVQKLIQETISDVDEHAKNSQLIAYS